jgi:pyruvate carboxylase subunit B
MSNYTVVVDGQKFNVTIAEGNANIQVTPVVNTCAPTDTNCTEGGAEVGASVSGTIWKIAVKVGDKVQKGDVIAIIEAMKMEIDVESPVSGTVAAISVAQNQAVEEGQTIAVIS